MNSMLQREICAVRVTESGQALLSSSGASLDKSRSGACAAWSTASGNGSLCSLGATSSSEYFSAITAGYQEVICTYGDHVNEQNMRN